MSEYKRNLLEQFVLSDSDVTDAVTGNFPSPALLVCEDDPDQQKAYAQMISDIGRTFVASNLSEVEEIHQRVGLSAALIDLNLDEHCLGSSEGIEVVKLLGAAGDKTQCAIFTGKDWENSTVHEWGAAGIGKKFFVKGENSNIISWMREAVPRSRMSPKALLEHAQDDLTDSKLSDEIERAADVIEFRENLAMIIAARTYPLWPRTPAEHNPLFVDKSSKVVFLNFWSRSFAAPVLLGIGLRAVLDRRFLPEALSGSINGIPLSQASKKPFSIQDNFSADHAILRAVTSQPRDAFVVHGDESRIELA